jgi:hypothetical protein
MRRLSGTRAKRASLRARRFGEQLWDIALDLALGPKPDTTINRHPRKPRTNKQPVGWTQPEVLAAMWEDPVAQAVVRKLVAWAAQRRLRVTGKTTKAPALAWHLVALGTDYELFSADSRLANSQASLLWIQMYRFNDKPILNDPARRVALIDTPQSAFRRCSSGLRAGNLTLWTTFWIVCGRR